MQTTLHFRQLLEEFRSKVVKSVELDRYGRVMQQRKAETDAKLEEILVDIKTVLDAHSWLKEELQRIKENK